MFVKKFTASTLEEALKKVKVELGEGALILTTTAHKGTLLKKAFVEVMAAQDKREKPTVAEKKAPVDLQKVFPYRRKTEVEADPPARASRYIDIAATPEATRTPGNKNSSSRFEDGFLRVGLSNDSARELSHRLVMDFPKNELGHPVTLEKLKTKLIANHIRVLTPEAVLGYKSFIAMGPPGSGKTSFLVKLSLYLKERGIRIALASRERRKVTGPGEMAQYAKILKVPFAHDLRDKRRDGCTLVDLSAMTLHSNGFKRDIDQLLGTLERPAPIMVLDSTQRTEDLMRSAEWAQKYSPVAVAFTKTDLASNFGGLYDFLRRTKIPLLSLSVSDSFRSGLRFCGQLDLASLILSGGFKTAFGEGN